MVFAYFALWVPNGCIQLLPHHALVLPSRCLHWFQNFLRSPHCALAHASLRMGDYMGAYGHHQRQTYRVEWSANPDILHIIFIFLYVSLTCI